MTNYPKPFGTNAMLTDTGSKSCAETATVISATSSKASD